MMRVQRFAAAIAALGLVFGVGGCQQPASAHLPTSQQPEQKELSNARRGGWTDLAESRALDPFLRGMHGHAVAVGDVNQDGATDIFVGTFADRPADRYQRRGATGPSPDRLLLATSHGYTVDETFPVVRGRTSGACFADFDEDGRLDLLVARNVRASGEPAAVTTLYRKTSEGWEIAREFPEVRGARAVAAVDYDGDGDLDLLIIADRWQGGSSLLFGSDGRGGFTNVSEEAGLPNDLVGLGVSVADLNDDRRPDLFVAGSNRMFINVGGRYAEADATVFEWTVHGREDDVSAIDVGDVNRDGRLDVLLGHHFNSTLEADRVEPVRLYLNEGPDRSGAPVFREITEAAGLIALPTKAPHVELVDLDNDGWLDVLTAASMRPQGSADEEVSPSFPAVFNHRGLENGIPRFDPPPGTLGRQYWVTGATFDADADGLLDVLLVEWFPELPSRFLGNIGGPRSGHWIAVGGRVADSRVLGARIEVFVAGHMGEPGAMLGAGEIPSSRGYAAGPLPRLHFGLGDHTSADVRISPLWGASAIELRNIDADRFYCVLGRC